MYTISTKSNPNVFGAITLKIVNKFPSNMAGISAANNTEQYVLKLSTSPCVCTHTLPCNVVRDRTVTKYCNFT